MNQISKLKTFYTLLLLAAFAIILLPVGIANVVFGYILHDSPCTSCWVQRMSMIFIGVTAMFIVRYGLRPKYLAVLLFMAAVGMYQSFAHFGYHAHHDIDQGFSLQVFGLHTYFWAEVVFWCVIVFLGVIFLLAPRFSAFNDSEQLNSLAPKFFRPAAIISAIIVASNVFQALVSTGIPPYLGQGDPVRFSLNPKYIIWDKSGWSKTYASFSMLGSRDVKAPDYAFAPASSALGISWSNDAAAGPLAVDQQLQIAAQTDLAISAPLNSLSAAHGGGYVASSKWDVMFLNEQFGRQDGLKIDPYFSSTIDPLIGVKAFGAGNYIAMGSNKTSLRFRPDAQASERAEFPQFLDGFDRFSATAPGTGRSRLNTIRAKFFHTGAIAADSKYFYLSTLPNNKNHKTLVISGVLQKDMKLAFEFEPSAALKPGRSLGELYITDMHYQNGKLLALSKNYNLIVQIDIASERVERVWALPAQIKNARALLVDEEGFRVLSYQDGKNVLFSLQ